MDEEQYISPKDTLARLVRLETKLCVKFEEMDKALVLARDLSTTQMNAALISLNSRLEGMNEFRRQLERQEAMFLKRQDLEAELKAAKELREAAVSALDNRLEESMKVMNRRVNVIEKWLFIGFGILLATQVGLHLILK